MQEKEIQNLEFYDELMILDLYARENLKTRPSWATDLKPYKKQIQEFYTKEEEQPEILKDYQGYQARQVEKMTHLEVFTYNVLDGKPEKGIYPVVFDYKKRNLLTYQGKISRVSFLTGEEV